jgi:hypothetical protein
MARRTERSMAKSGSQPFGGMILHIPYLLALSYMLLIYSIGSRNSSSVGVNVGASISPCGLFLGGGSRVKGLLRSTVFMSRGAARRALYGMVGGAELGIAPFGRVIGADFAGAGLWVGFPPVEGGATIVGDKGSKVIGLSRGQVVKMRDFACSAGSSALGV